MVATEDIINNSKLTHVDPSKPGISRKGTPGKFYYEDNKGKRVAKAHLERIKALVLPPAWKNVWISPKKNGYLQAVGVDVAGRKQYRYHTDWVKRKSDAKYFNLLAFGKTLTNARKQVAKDLRRKKWDERKVLAICIQLLQKTMIRIGNGAYEKAYGSFGLSTLKDKHFTLNGKKSTLCFVGKKGVGQSLTLNDARLAKMIKKCKDIPGRELFQYYTEAGEHKAVDSGMINDYIKEITGGDFTAKDFRTWGGTLEALRQLAICSAQNPQMNKKKLAIEALDCVAERLGNTRAVCKSSYVYPLVLTMFEEGKLGRYLKKVNCQTPDSTNGLQHDEKVLMQLLKQQK